jgi:hypothetical protein
MKKLYVLGLLVGMCFSMKGQGPLRCDAPHNLSLLPQKVKAATLRERDNLNALEGQKAETQRQFCHQTYRIPVVFHVIHHRTVDSISQAQIETQMTVLNQDYMKMTGSPGFGTGVNANISFYLARRDPTGAPTSGITYTKDNISNFSYGFANDSTLKSKIKWPQDRYLNIWVVDTIKYAGSYLLGYSSFPSGGLNPYDGIVIADQYIGRDTGTAKRPPYNKGRTVTHEVGHYLGLYHPFDYVNRTCEGDSAANCNTSGDFVCDVPPHAYPHGGCPGVPQNTCFEFPKDTNDYIHNYMEYVNDTCMNMFSAGQATRMQNTLDTDSFRIILTSTMNLIGTDIWYYGFPDAFFAFAGTGCRGDSIHLMEFSLGVGPRPMPTPDSKWKWSLHGGVPDTSNLRNPVVMYPDTGLFIIKLTVQNNIGFCTYMRPYHVQGARISTSCDTAALGNPTNFISFSDEPGFWSWNFGDGTGDSAATVPFPQHNYLTADTFIYTATFTPMVPGHYCVVRYRDTALVVTTPLQATLADFGGSRTATGMVNLHWKTLNEVNNDYFGIERSDNGNDFVEIDTLNGKGNSTETVHYSFTDEGVTDYKGYWYRLRQFDNDGGQSTSEVIYILPKGEIRLKTWPNPASDWIYLELQGTAELENYVVRLSDAMGRSVKRQKLLLGGSSPQQAIDVHALREGVYTLQLQDERTGKLVSRQKIVVTH